MAEIPGTTVVQADVPAQNVTILPAQTAAQQKHALDPSLPATTTSQEDLVTAGQRKVNLIWERTQSTIAVVMTGAYVYAQLTGVQSDGLANSFFLIVGFYFSRTNHAAIGGVGAKPMPFYQGR